MYTPMATTARARPQPQNIARAVQLRAMIKHLEQQRVSLCARMRQLEQEIQVLQAPAQLKTPK